VMAKRITTADLTKTARNGAWVLLSYYPVAGLQALAEVSAKVDIHVRSIIRCVTKLGFVGYPKYKKSFNQEVL
jgi:DNA-binding MurR/RpiR family transcriptional regulator